MLTEIVELTCPWTFSYSLVNTFDDRDSLKSPHRVCRRLSQLDLFGILFVNVGITVLSYVYIFIKVKRSAKPMWGHTQYHSSINKPVQSSK